MKVHEAVFEDGIGDKFEGEIGVSDEMVEVVVKGELEFASVEVVGL